MKEFVYLFPHLEYVESTLSTSNRQRKEKVFSHLSDIINIRYRQEDYRINWLVFKSPQGGADMEGVDKNFPIYDKDNIVVADLTFSQATNPSDPRYVDNNHVLQQISQNPNDLVIGGFHLWSCVEKLAKEAYSRGIPTYVDEDTTELYFMNSKALYTPLVRDREYYLVNEMDEVMIDYANNVRGKLPWMPKLKSATL